LIFLLNRERVLLEVVELARLKIAGVLRVPAEAVSAHLERKDDKASPVFDISMDEAKGLTQDMVREVIASVYAETSMELANRLAGLSETRRALGEAA
jgi:hypothetical protein